VKAPLTFHQFLEMMWRISASSCSASYMASNMQNNILPNFKAGGSSLWICRLMMVAAASAALAYRGPSLVISTPWKTGAGGCPCPIGSLFEQHLDNAEA